MARRLALAAGWPGRAYGSDRRQIEFESLHASRVIGASAATIAAGANVDPVTFRALGPNWFWFRQRSTSRSGASGTHWFAGWSRKAQAPTRSVVPPAHHAPA